MQGETAPARDALLTALAVLMALMALSNFLKPLTQHFDPNEQAGFVFLGTRQHGIANAILGPLFGVLLAAYAYGVWTMRRFALPIACFYAGYVIVNLVLFTLNEPAARQPSMIFMFGYAAVAIGCADPLSADRSSGAGGRD